MATMKAILEIKRTVLAGIVNTPPATTITLAFDVPMKFLATLTLRESDNALQLRVEATS